MLYYVTIHVISYDIWFYISHIILHKNIAYRLIRKQHHSTDYRTLRYSDTYIGHFIESPFQGLGFLFPLLFIKFDIYAFLLALIIVNVRGMLRHDNKCIWLIGNHHILHHKYPQYNFGEFWIDWLFGTNYTNTDEYIQGIIYM